MATLMTVKWKSTQEEVNPLEAIKKALESFPNVEFSEETVFEVQEIVDGNVTKEYEIDISSDGCNPYKDIDVFEPKEHLFSKSYNEYELEQAKEVIKKNNICAVYWSPEDVKERLKNNYGDNYEISDENCIKIIQAMDRNQDAERGVSWETIDFYIELLENGTLDDDLHIN